MRDPGSSSATWADDKATIHDAPSEVVARTVAGRGRCDLAKLRIALAGLARGLSVLHAAGKVHRDVKPSNILVEDSGRVVLLDFGVVAELGEAFHEKLVFRSSSADSARREAAARARR
jgi:serine/threonine protein kinase